MEPNCMTQLDTPWRLQRAVAINLGLLASIPEVLLAKNYKPTWTKTSLRLVFVLRWN